MYPSITTLVFVSLAQIALFASPAFAIQGADFRYVNLRQEAATRLIHFSGVLSCDMGSENTGAGCTLKFKDKKSGQVYELSNSEQAMNLFQSGRQNVVIDGSMAGSRTIEVARVSAI